MAETRILQLTPAISIDGLEWYELARETSPGV